MLTSLNHHLYLFYSIAFALEFLFLYPLFALFKWKLLKRLGVPRRERKVVFSNRKQLFDLKHFISQYGDRNLRIVDGLSRKLLHVVAGVWQLIILNLFIKDTHIALQATLVYQILLVILSSISYSSNQIFGLAGLLYGASSRIRDGVWGRKNLFVARLSFLNLLPLALIDALAQNQVNNPERLVIFSFFVFLPLTIGDALGELIGTVWGKQKLRVWGIGQINRKSLLGTTAVFLGSLIPLLVIVTLKSLSIEWYLLCIAISTATTGIELAAPRGTDNFFIPIGNALICLVFITLYIPF